MTSVEAMGVGNTLGLEAWEMGQSGTGRSGQAGLPIAMCRTAGYPLCTTQDFGYIDADYLNTWRYLEASINTGAWPTGRVL